MAYQKFLVDNLACSRRFHLIFDSDDTPVAKTEVKCQFCNATIFVAENHPAVKLAREENLIKTSTLSDQLMRECFFEDTFSKNGPQPSPHKNRHPSGDSHG